MIRPDTTMRILAFAFAFFVVGLSFYGLVIYPLVLEDLVKGYLISIGTLGVKFVFDQELAKATAASSQKAYDKGLATPTPTNGTPPFEPGGTP